MSQSTDSTMTQKHFCDEAGHEDIEMEENEFGMKCPQCVEDTWETVYDIVDGEDFNDLIGDPVYGIVPELERFSSKGSYHTAYYQTYGGGPEGGYFIKPYFNGFKFKEKVYEVNRDWLQSFTFKETTKAYEVRTTDDGQTQIRVY